MLVSNIFSTIGMILLLVSTFSRSKDGVLKFQVGDALFNSIANLLIGSYSGALTCFIALVRNLLLITKKMSKPIGLSLICVTLIVGLIVNTKGFIGLFPIVASLSYSLLSWLCKTAVGVKWALILNLTLWAVHDLCVGLPIAFIVDCFIALVTLVNIRRCEDGLHSEGLQDNK